MQAKAVTEHVANGRLTEKALKAHTFPSGQPDVDATGLRTPDRFGEKMMTRAPCARPHQGRQPVMPVAQAFL